VTGKPLMTERILLAADRLFYHRGIRAVGVDAVAAEAGISKRSLYDYFPSKDALVAAYLQRRFLLPPASDAPARDQVLAVFDRLGSSFAEDGFRGCPFVNAVTELGGSCQAADLAGQYKEQRRHWFKDMLDRAGAADPDRLATQISMLVDGAITAMLVRNDSTAWVAARDAADVLMMAAGIVRDTNRTTRSAS